MDPDFSFNYQVGLVSLIKYRRTLAQMSRMSHHNRLHCSPQVHQNFLLAVRLYLGIMEASNIL